MYDTKSFVSFVRDVIVRAHMKSGNSQMYEGDFFDCIVVSLAEHMHGRLVISSLMSYKRAKIEAVVVGCYAVPSLFANTNAPRVTR